MSLTSSFDVWDLTSQTGSRVTLALNRSGNFERTLRAARAEAEQSKYASSLG